MTASEEVRRLRPEASITLIGNDEAPYARMALPYLIKKQIDEAGTHIRLSPKHYDNLNIELIEGTVESVDASARKLDISMNGTSQQIDYDKLLIASGGSPLTPPIEGIDLPGVSPCWTLAHARQIMQRARPGADIVLIGAGFISTTIVEGLVTDDGNLTIIEQEDRLIPRMMDGRGSAIIRSWCEKKGVHVITSSRVERISQSENRLVVAITGHDSIEADLVISATGVAPNVGFLQSSGIRLDQGVLVDAYLQSSAVDVYAAGDVAQAPDLLSGGKTVMAIQPVAVEHGRVAAINMVKGNKLAWRGNINMNVLDLLGLVSCSFGLWQGVKDGDNAEVYHPDQHRYMKLQFDHDRLVGASSVGYTEHVGVIQGLIQGRVSLGKWKQKLMDDPTRLMEAWIGSTHGFSKPINPA